MNETDDTWEDFFGPSTELMPGILSALDRILDKSIDDEDQQAKKPLGSPRKLHKTNNFQLSFNVQKILSNVATAEDEEEWTRQTSKDCDLKRNHSTYSSRRLLERNKSNESLELLPSVQKMLSNVPDTELVIAAGDRKHKCSVDNMEKVASSGEFEVTLVSGDAQCGTGDGPSKPLGNYRHSTVSGIASRTPTGRKNMGKYLQVPSESSVGTLSTTSSEVSRPVSLTSLGSCSSSGSSCALQPGSAYQASEESLESDPESSGIQGSADSGIADDDTCSNISKKEYDVVAEIVNTEDKYVEDLNKVIQDYLLPWKSDPDCFLYQHIPTLFSNLEEIYEFNRSFLEELREAKLNPSATSKLFINNTGFSIYTDYCTNYPKTISVLTQLMGDKESAEHFKTVQTNRNHDLPLGSYLLKPVQRILRYRMLLERLSERCDARHKPVVDLALTSMTGVASHINSMKRKHEIAIRTQEIQSQLYGWSGPDLTTLGELIAEGTFRLGTRKGRRHVFLFDKLLLLTKCRPDGNFSYKSHIMCSNLMLVEQVRGEPLSFHVLPFDNPRDQVTLRARSVQHKREWTGQLKRVIIENYNAAIPNHAQQLLMQLGQDLPEKEESSEMWTPLKKQHSTPHYLERRSRVRQSRGDLASRRAASHDRSFPSLANWRRRSEPDVQQYDNKTVPSRISKLKKAKGATSTFYTDLSDSETCEHSDIPVEVAEEAAEVSFDGSLKESETDPNIYGMVDGKGAANSKADSLPRSFQLNDGIYVDKDGVGSGMVGVGLQAAIGELVSSTTHLDNYPEHKIYRKSTIRLSLMQRYHAIKDRPRKSNPKKQNSSNKAIGERIANPDYEDPHKIFDSMTSLNRSTLSVDVTKCEYVEFEAPEYLDMTINEHEVLKALNERLTENEVNSSQDKKTDSSRGNDDFKREIIDSSRENIDSSRENNNSSHENSDYYECLLEKSLNDENVAERCDSFRKKPDVAAKTVENVCRGVVSCRERLVVKEPPPVPAKPLKVLNRLRSSSGGRNVEDVMKSSSDLSGEERRCQSRGWVKTVIGRFE